MKIPSLSKSYNGRTVLNTPEIELRSGRIYALTGANGSGKTTLARILAGVEKSDKSLASLGVSVGYMPQKSYAFRMSTRSNIMLGGCDNEKCTELMRAVHIEHLADKRGRSLSGGECARMALSRLMMKDYGLVILDEPTASMDMESTLLSEELLIKYCRESNCSLLLVTHSLQQARRVADDILFLSEGELAEFCGKEDFFTKSVDLRARRFLSFYGL